MAKRNDWSPDEDAIVLHIIERVVLDEKHTLEDAFEEASKDKTLVSKGRTIGGIKYNWNKKLKKQATGRLGEWVRQSVNFSTRHTSGDVPVIRPASRRAQLLSLLQLANQELEGIDGQIDQFSEKITMLHHRKIELNKNMKGLMEEFQEITIDVQPDQTNGEVIEADKEKDDGESA